MFIGSYTDPSAPDARLTVDDPFIDDKVYATIVQKFPIPCTDILLTMPGDKALYLVKRKVYPHPHWWTLGGRVMFNDMSLEASAARCLKREAKLDVSLDRFRPCGTSYYQWARTAQANTPGKNFVVLFAFMMTEKERAHISENLDEKEFDTSQGIRRFTRKELVLAKCHPVLLETYDVLFPSILKRFERFAA